MTVVQMFAQVSSLVLLGLRGGLLIHTQSQATTADLRLIIITLHVTLVFRDLAATIQLITAEALAGPFGTGHAIPFATAVFNTLGCGRPRMTKPSQSDSIKNACRRIIRVAAKIGPARVIDDTRIVVGRSTRARGRASSGSSGSACRSGTGCTSSIGSPSACLGVACG